MVSESHTLSMNSNPVRMSFTSRFCITLVATLLVALFPKGPSDTPASTAEVSDRTATSSTRLTETSSITEQRNEAPPILAPL